ncbi:hypothetical protein [Xanthomonas campestris]|uniref:hypothetical protein n=1 Tax=Xanthomonas campestris TaxID=339 RepID=UPI0023682995|nr:hypothetical protein [Xanthomonas campestris]WDJ87449.1 hypothetical protein JH279_22130 [Xanthomonas campestris pv. incanae]WDJ96217.1 hypothetical protein JH260_21695 [Xanthomonas campestris pv. incanae]
MNNKHPLGKLGARAARNTAPVPADPAPSGFEDSQPRPAARPSQAQSADAGKVQGGKRRRGTNESGVVTMTVRLRREDWARLVELRMTEGKTGQEVFFEGLAAVFARYGFDAPQAP